MTIWIIGPVAWDSVVYTDQWLKRGAFTQGVRFIERSGGTAANVARALATANVDTGFIGYLGNDQHGRDIEADLKASQINQLEITKIDGPTSHVLILVDDSGERTILGLAADHLDVVNLQNVDLKPDDIVVFVLWRNHFAADLELAKSRGCKIIVGLDAANDPAVQSADIAIGSHNDLAKGIEPNELLNRFATIVVTQGEKGATEYSKNSKTHQPAFPAEVIDTTGAGDAFLAGYLTALSRGESDAKQRLSMGAKWAAKTVATESSVPPPFGSL
ncbi:MAG: carbohydrate kinase family protein [Micrococcales bacterium]